VGIVCIASGSTKPYISAEAFQAVLKPGVENTSALLEELGLRNKALYLPSTPSTMGDGHSQTIIPLGDRDIGAMEGKIPGRFIVRYGADPNGMAIAIATLGSFSLDFLKTRPGPTPEEIESAISYILTGVFDLADSATVDLSNAHIEVTVKGAKLLYEDVWYHRCLGSPIASMVAAICSEALGKPVRVEGESYGGKEGHIILEVVP
jgi:hypothetical protein